MKDVFITEVGPRDGLQNIGRFVPTEAKIDFIEGLVGAGCKQIEVGAFVHPKRVPQMADAELIFKRLERRSDVRYLALVPNVRGYERARAAGCDAIALFTAASEGFARANINMTIAESLKVFEQVASRAHKDGVAVRGYVSTVFACPFDGPTAPEQVLPVVRRLADLGVYEISLGDTIGMGTPADVRRLLDLLGQHVRSDDLVMHFHDTWGMAIANVAASLELGIRRFDGSTGGLGGCPYAKSATGNVATEDLLYLLDHMGYHTGLELEDIVSTGHRLAEHLDAALPGRVFNAYTKAYMDEDDIAASKSSSGRD